MDLVLISKWLIKVANKIETISHRMMMMTIVMIASKITVAWLKLTKQIVTESLLSKTIKLEKITT